MPLVYVTDWPMRMPYSDRWRRAFDLKQGYLDSTDLRIIDEMARELRSRDDDNVTFDARRHRIFTLYLEGWQTLDEIRTELARQTEASLPASSEN